jgi:hypothetical protein
VFEQLESNDLVLFFSSSESLVVCRIKPSPTPFCGWRIKGSALPHHSSHRLSKSLFASLSHMFCGSLESYFSTAASSRGEPTSPDFRPSTSTAFNQLREFCGAGLYLGPARNARGG